MFQARLLFVMLALMGAMSCRTSPTAAREIGDAMAERYAPGQTWSYKNRPGEDGSRITVLEIDHYPQAGTIVHVAVSGLHMKNHLAPGGEATVVGHLPLAQSALDASVVVLVGSGAALPDYRKGYEIWKDAFEHGKGGIFTLPVSEIITAMETTVNQ